jgi:hypothetical protein
MIFSIGLNKPLDPEQIMDMSLIERLVALHEGQFELSREAEGGPNLRVTIHTKRA